MKVLVGLELFMSHKKRDRIPDYMLRSVFLLHWRCCYDAVLSCPLNTVHPRRSVFVFILPVDLSRGRKGSGKHVFWSGGCVDHWCFSAALRLSYTVSIYMFLFSVFSIWTDEKLNLAVVRWKKYDVNNKCRATNYCSQQDNECSCFFWSKWGTDFLLMHRNKHKQNIHCVGCTYSVSASNSGENTFPMVRKVLQPLFCSLHFDQCQKKISSSFSKEMSKDWHSKSLSRKNS